MKNEQILLSVSGEKILDRDSWEKYRRREILDLFQGYVYGRRPVDRPDGLTFEVAETVENFAGLPVTYQQIAVCFSGYSFRVQGFVPQSAKPVPAFVYIMIERQENHSDLMKQPDNTFLPIPEITARGYAVFVLPTSGIYPDWEHRADYRSGVFAVLGPDREKRRGDDWATLSAWSWGASRVMDYLETDRRIDRNAVAVIGHSRGGKTALWCAANDERFSFAVSNASGCMGASMLKGKTGEHIKDINCTDWFCGNFRRFDDREDLLPVDQHMLLALIAPRLLYVESCSEDDWADPVNERLSCRLASEVYEKIYGLPGVLLPCEPVPADTPYHGGCIGYHMKSGGHSISAYDWRQYMDFWDAKRAQSGKNLP